MTGSTQQTLSTNRPQNADVHSFEVTHVERDAYAVDSRGHRLRVDQPIEAGGTDTAPTPTELFAASLATCIAFYPGRFRHRHGSARQDRGSVRSSPWPPTAPPASPPRAS